MLVLCSLFEAPSPELTFLHDSCKDIFLRIISPRPVTPAYIEHQRYILIMKYIYI